MKFKKIIPYKMKHVLPILGLAGASVVSSCEKVPQTEPEQPVKTEVELIFYVNNMQVLGIPNDSKYIIGDIVKYYTEKPEIQTIYLCPQGTWNLVPATSIYVLRKNMLQKLIEYSPKIRGRGDFDFMLGEASQVPEDSLWYVQNGWTINKKYQR